MAEVVNDHANKLETVTKILKALNAKDDEQDDRIQAMRDSDTELKQKLKLLEGQINSANTDIKKNDDDISGRTFPPTRHRTGSDLGDTRD